MSRSVASRRPQLFQGPIVPWRGGSASHSVRKGFSIIPRGYGSHIPASLLKRRRGTSPSFLSCTWIVQIGCKPRGPSYWSCSALIRSSMLKKGMPEVTDLDSETLLNHLTRAARLALAYDTYLTISNSGLSGRNLQSPPTALYHAHTRFGRICSRTCLLRWLYFVNLCPRTGLFLIVS